MTRIKKVWISPSEATAILTANTDHEVSIDYVRLLARSHKFEYRVKNARENEYLKSDVEAYRVRPQHTPRVRPRPSTRHERLTHDT